MQNVESGKSTDIGKDDELEGLSIDDAVSSLFNGINFTSHTSNREKEVLHYYKKRLKNLRITPLPTGLIPRIEYSRKHLDFISTSFNLPYIMLNLDVVERLTDKDLTAHDIYRCGDVITTSTIHDNVLCNYNVEREINVIKKFEPAWHIPCDYPTYYEDCDEGRKWFIDAIVEDTMTFMEAVEGTSIGVLPLVKGINENEWKWSISRFKEMGISYFAFYVKQYFGSNNGKNDKLMVKHIRRMVYSCHPDYLMLLGYQSPLRLQDIPPEVQAFAGERWIRGSKLNKLPLEQAGTEYLDWKRRFEEQGIHRQTVLNFKEESLSQEGY